MSKYLASKSLVSKLGQYQSLVKFEHTVFALPFALSAMLLAVNEQGGSGLQQWPSLQTTLAVLLAMVGGRTYAMGLNRLIDAKIDAENPRTASREIPAGQVKQTEAWTIVGISLIVFTGATLCLPPICLKLLPIALVILTGYSYVKRFSMLAHLVLGLALASSAIGGWVAQTGELSGLSVLFGAVVLCWVSGFDIIYACQDYSFDQEAGLKSIPVALGLKGALHASRFLHVLTVVLFSSFVYSYDQTNWWLWIAVLITAGMLIYEHRLIRGKTQDTPLCFENINAAFFEMNGKISVAVFCCVVFSRLF
ncbi:MAG: UbiA-like polyprenyltransferase [Cyanobacteria bacterium P01_H01_bin.74]